MVFLLDTIASDRHPDQCGLLYKLNRHCGFIAHATHYVTFC